MPVPDPLPIRESPSPNHDARPDGAPVDMLVLHYTGMPDAASAIARLCDPSAKISAHYVIDEDGTILRLVDEDRRAWHAGVSSWRGQANVNARSIGIELVNPGHEFGYRSFPDAQMAACATLARDILARHPIPPGNVVGHADVAPERKQDPGERFDWARLAAAGVGLWPFRDLGTPGGPSDMPLAAVQSLLVSIGYAVGAPGALDGPTLAAVEAFQRHFRPALVQGFPDLNTVRRLEVIANLVR